MDFGTNQGRPRSQCKPCRNAVKKLQREANRERVLAQKKAYRERKAAELAAKQKAYRERDLEAYKAHMREWRLANWDKVLVSKREHYAKNPEKYALYSKRTYEKCPERYRAAGVRRRLIEKQQTPAWADREKMLDIYREANELRRRGFNVHVDHIYPLKGKTVCGFHSHHNLRLMFAKDNLSKGAKLPDEEDEIA